MNFLTWLGKRMLKTFVKPKFEWVEEYRRTILREKPISIVLTFFGGLCWTIIIMVSAILLVQSRETITTIFQFTVSAVPIFYVYNWIMALYEVYETEKMATWNTLKE